MRAFIDIISEATGSGSFALAPGLDPKNYQITASLADAASWKAMTFAGDGSVNRGAMGPVGYVWISKTNNTIVPISRGDEHHEGSDMVYEMVETGAFRFNPHDYMPVWPQGNNFIYDRKDISVWITVLTKYLSWGGKNGLMHGANDQRGLMLDYRSFIEHEGIVVGAAGTLSPMGQRFYDLHIALQKAILAANGSNKASVVMAPFKIAAEIVKYVGSLSYHAPAEGFGADTLKAFVKQLREVTKARDVQALSELMFGFNSPKRAFHEKIRHTAPKDWDYDKLKAFWGDVPYAENLLAHL